MSFGKGSRGGGVSKTGKRLGRPPKKAVDETPRVEVLSVDEDKLYTFKSKFREDVITLKKSHRKDNPDGSTTLEHRVDAEFHRNTWSTKKAWEAGVLRDMIQDRKDTDPIHIVETTP